MRDLIYIIAWIGLFFVMLMLIVSNVYWHIISPDVTETRLFLMHWKQYVSMIVAFFALYVIVKLTEK